MGCPLAGRLLLAFSLLSFCRFLLLTFAVARDAFVAMFLRPIAGIVGDDECNHLFGEVSQGTAASIKNLRTQESRPERRLLPLSKNDRAHHERAQPHG